MKGVWQMSKNRAIVVGVLAGTLALVLAAGVAWAATVQCQENAPGDPVQVCLGTTGADTITGTSGVDWIRALGGNDLARGMGGPDTFLFGGESGPQFEGGPFTDASDDYTYGGSGGDTIIGGYAQGGVDRVFGEDGDDYIQTYQRGLAKDLDIVVTKEIINCGAGDDTVVFDEGKDEVAQNCENLYPVGPGGEGAPFD